MRADSRKNKGGRVAVVGQECIHNKKFVVFRKNILRKSRISFYNKEKLKINEKGWERRYEKEGGRVYDGKR